MPIVNSAGPWVRGHAVGFGPIFFGRTGLSRFDAPDGEYGVLYVAADVHAAFIETFGRRETSGQSLGLNIVRMAELAAREIAQVLASRPLRLVDLAGNGLARIGADGRLATGSYSVARRWALALYQHPSQPDRLPFRSRHDPSRFAAAIFDRAGDTLSTTSLGSLANPDQAQLLADILETYEFDLIE